MNRCLMRRRRRVTSSKGIRRDVSVDSARYPGRLLRAAARLDHPRCMSTEDPKVVTLFDPKSVLTVYYLSSCNIWTEWCLLQQRAKLLSKGIRRDVSASSGVDSSLIVTRFDPKSVLTVCVLSSFNISRLSQCQISLSPARCLWALLRAVAWLDHPRYISIEDFQESKI